MSKFLSKGEMLLLALLIVSIVLELLEINMPILFIISLAGLGAVFFLYAQMPSNKESSNQDQVFKYLLGLTIVPKILWISTSLTTVGIIFYTQDFAGATKLLTIGGITIAFCTVILLILRFMKINGLEKVFSILYRAYPAVLGAAYFVFA